MLYLRYLNGNNDGFGAQYQRIIGIYCICKGLNIKYIHNSFTDIEYQGLNSLSINQNSNEFINECNNRIKIESDEDISNIENITQINQVDIDIDTINKYKDDSMKNNKNIIINIIKPYNITDKNPNLYKHAFNIYKSVIPKNDVFTIGIHVRRGELHVVDSDRMLSNKFYIQNAQRIIKLCEEKNINYIVELYTEVPDNNIVVTNKHVGVFGRVPKNITISKDVDNISEFNILPNLHKYINEKMLDTFDRMINCDILIGSRSSLTACASYIKDGITVYHKFWHKLISTDIEAHDPLFNNKINSFLNKSNINKQSIPKCIYQVWLQGNENNVIKNNILSINSGYKYLFFDEKLCYEYIKNNFSSEILNTFINIKNLAHKCDLFRYCLLYNEGGVYIDYDLQLFVSIDEIINLSNNSDLITALGAHSNDKFGECTNGFIITKKKNPIFLKLINTIINIPNPVDYGNNVKDIYNKLNKPSAFKQYNLYDNNIYLFKEVSNFGKYYIIDNNNKILINTNGHDYINNSKSK